MDNFLYKRLWTILLVLLWDIYIWASKGQTYTLHDHEHLPDIWSKVQNNLKLIAPGLLHREAAQDTAVIHLCCPLHPLLIPPTPIP